ncbi:MAG: tetratricopeptide repeat protein [Candidatus Omnitrophota bacterium]
MNFNKTLTLSLILILILGVSLCFASALKEEAIIYRQKGFEAQSSGDLDTAMKFYQKALEFEPYYPGVYNDLGVVFEAKGWNGRAEQFYLKAIEIDPKYTNPYTNLALLYTKKGDLRKASAYWKKRAEMGSPLDPWTIKAQEEYHKIANAYPDMKNVIIEQEAIELVDTVSRQKQLQAAHPEIAAKENLRRAKYYYKQQEYASALRELLNAQRLDPHNKEINKLIEIIQKKILL